MWVVGFEMLITACMSRFPVNFRGQFWILLHDQDIQEWKNPVSGGRDLLYIVGWTEQTPGQWIMSRIVIVILKRVWNNAVALTRHLPWRAEENYGRCRMQAYCITATTDRLMAAASSLRDGVRGTVTPVLSRNGRSPSSRVRVHSHRCAALGTRLCGPHKRKMQCPRDSSQQTTDTQTHWRRVLGTKVATSRRIVWTHETGTTVHRELTGQTELQVSEHSVSQRHQKQHVSWTNVTIWWQRWWQALQPHNTPGSASQLGTNVSEESAASFFMVGK
jgi:hypothetical protein